MTTPGPDGREQGWAVRVPERSLGRFRRDSSGASAIEYGLIAGLVFLVITGGLRLYADRVMVMYNFISSSILGAG